jgi:LysM repeat protein
VTLGSRGSRTRCLVVWCCATTALVATASLARAGVAGGVAAVGRHRLGALPFDRALADLAGALLLGCAVWLWLVTSYVVLEAARGRTDRRRGPRWVPVGLRRLVLSGCGVAVVGALAQPAVAVGTGAHHDHHRPPPRAVVHSPVAGLPLPERAALTTHPRVVTVSRSHEPPGPTVVVAAGDTLWSIAARGLPASAPDAVIARRWRAIYAANRSRIGPDPDLIVPGQRLLLPGKDLP